MVRTVLPHLSKTVMGCSQMQVPASSPGSGRPATRLAARLLCPNRSGTQCGSGCVTRQTCRMTGMVWYFRQCSRR